METRPDPIELWEQYAGLAMSAFLGKEDNILEAIERQPNDEGKYTPAVADFAFDMASEMMAARDRRLGELAPFVPDETADGVATDRMRLAKLALAKNLLKTPSFKKLSGKDKELVTDTFIIAFLQGLMCTDVVVDGVAKDAGLTVE